MRYLKERPWTSLALLAVALVVSAFGLAACGSSSESTSTSSAPTESPGASEGSGSFASTPEGKAVSATYDELLKGNYQPAPTKGPPAQKGKKVWIISCGQEYETCAQMAKTFAEAGEKLGWETTIQDSKASQEQAGTLVKQAIAAGANGVATFTTDCPNIKSALTEAKSHNVAVVSLGGLDCNFEGFGGGEPLFAGAPNVRGSTEFSVWGAEYAANRAAVLIHELNGEGEILSIEEQSQAAQQVFDKAFDEEIEKNCPKCTLTKVPFTFSEVPTKANQIFQTAIQSHPNAAAISVPIESLMPLGLGSIIQSSGHGMFVMGAEAITPNLELIESGVISAALGTSSYEWQSWSMADTLNRIFAGSKEFPNDGGGWILVDKEHNLPPAGQPVKPPIDFRAAFEKIWNG